MKVATLNFSGVNTSPFEYDDGTALFVSINQNVRDILRKEHPELKEWKCGKIDKEFTSSERQSVCFNSRMETIRMRFFKRLPNKEQFFKHWKDNFNQWTKHNEFSKRPTEEEVHNCSLMDYVFYRALLQFVYKVTSYEELQKNLHEYPPHLLEEFLQEQFNRPASKTNVKKDMVVDYLLNKDLDIMFLQEAGSVDWSKEHIPGYECQYNHDSAILYKEGKVGKMNISLMEKYASSLDFNKDSAFLFTSKNYLILSVHLKSKKEVNVEQAKEMFAVLSGIKQSHPELKIVIGMDANNYLTQEKYLDCKGNTLCFMVPQTKEKVTTLKKRSFMQAQLKKAGEEISEVKDHIASSHPITAYRIEKINGKDSSNELLPNNEHPYDHYVVRSTIKFDQ